MANGEEEEQVEEKDRGQMAMGRDDVKDGWRDGGSGGREAVGCHVQPAAAGAHGNKMEIAAGFSQKNRYLIFYLHFFYLKNSKNQAFIF